MDERVIHIKPNLSAKIRSAVDTINNRGGISRVHSAPYLNVKVDKRRTRVRDDANVVSPLSRGGEID